jgi:hypothetical protein
VCCGTKRLVEISCPADCAWLAGAREHPAAAVLRRQQRDRETVAPFVRDFSERQSQLFILIAAFLSSYRPGELQTLLDDDVTQGTEALASTYETAARGVIYEHRPASPVAARLAAELKALLAETRERAGPGFDHDALVVLRSVREAVDAARASDPENSRAFLELVSRIIQPLMANRPEKRGEIQLTDET